MNKEYMPLAVAVFLVASGLLFGSLFLPQNGVTEGRSGLGGAAIIPSAQGAEIDNNAALNVQDASFFAAANKGNEGNNQGLADASYSSSHAMVQNVGVSTGASTNRSEVISYIVQKGDTLSSVASYFGISPSTILAANPVVQRSGIKTKEVIKILPTSGVLYEAVAGDTLASIANIFNISEDDLLQYNPSIDSSFITPGTLIVVPNDGAATAAL
jgi:LysM repeat protein